MSHEQNESFKLTNIRSQHWYILCKMAIQRYDEPHCVKMSRASHSESNLHSFVFTSVCVLCTRQAISISYVSKMWISDSHFKRTPLSRSLRRPLTVLYLCYALFIHGMAKHNCCYLLFALYFKWKKPTLWTRQQQLQTAMAVAVGPAKMLLAYSFEHIIITELYKRHSHEFTYIHLAGSIWLCRSTWNQELTNA